jgi:hypothetical protein
MSDFLEALSSFYHHPYFRYPLFFSMIITIFSFIFSIIKYLVHCPSDFCDDDHFYNAQYDEEIKSLLCDSPAQTINLLFESDKDYLVDYFTEHLDYFYEDLFSDEE